MSSPFWPYWDLRRLVPRRNRPPTRRRPSQLLQGREVEQGWAADWEMVFAGNSLAKAQRIFENFTKKRPRVRLTIRQRTRVLQEWPPSR